MSSMDLDDEINPYEYNLHNNMAVSFSYLEEGFCEFLVSKWQRILKDLKNKN
jgi:hypothetical protein